LVGIREKEREREKEKAYFTYINTMAVNSARFDPRERKTVSQSNRGVTSMVLA